LAALKHLGAFQAFDLILSHLGTGFTVSISPE
jgi:hypothetical protein